ncbi:prolyl hydroxylase family protein [Singulisphaera sp. PoT]|uniref:prolyl hydroxylase family protein n=1 Tax=Singulisphaera sp. PoT TaxID=3411797 RepID=UPI003BF52A02
MIRRELADSVYIIEGFMTPEECGEVIGETEDIGYEAAPIQTIDGMRILSDVRNNTRVILDDFERANFLWERVKAEVPTFHGGRQAIAVNERFRFYRYAPGEHFARHQDAPFRRDNGEVSQFTFMVYLNEDFVGGETIFNDVGVRPKTGMALIFKHDLPHEGSAVKQGIKYVLRSDIMYDRIGKIRG